MSTIKSILNLFPQKDYSPIWEEFARMNKGEYKFDLRDCVKLTYTNFDILIDQHEHCISGTSYSSVYLRFQCEIPDTNNFKFRLVPEEWIEKIGKLFGLKDIQLNDASFDKKFLIQSNDLSLVKNLFESQSLKLALQDIPLIRLALGNEPGIFDEKATEGNTLLYLISEIEVTDIIHLNKHFDVFLKILKEVEP